MKAIGQGIAAAVAILAGVYLVAKGNSDGWWLVGAAVLLMAP